MAENVNLQGPLMGFTGARRGMTEAQRSSVRQIIKVLAPSAGLHGGCVGADADFDALCVAEGLPTKCRPCIHDGLKAEGLAAEMVAEPVRPMQRNRDIVDDAHVMVACPPNRDMIKTGSGTWATVKFTRRANKPLFLVFPEGDVAEERTMFVRDRV